MSDSWQFQKAKSKLGELIDRAIEHGPQIIERDGKSVVVVVSVDEYRLMKKRRTPLSKFFRSSPLAGVDLTRVRDMPRKQPRS